MVKDMTNGSPSKHILGFAVPMLFGMLFQQFYNLVDTIIVGKTLGVEALAGVGATGSINFMIIGFCMGVCNGFVIPVAQCFGAKKPADLRKYVFNGYICSIVFAIVLTLASVIFCRRILIVMNTPADIIDHAYNYIVVIFIGIPTVFLSSMGIPGLKYPAAGRSPDIKKAEAGLRFFYMPYRLHRIKSLSLSRSSAVICIIRSIACRRSRSGPPAGPWPVMTHSAE